MDAEQSRIWNMFQENDGLSRREIAGIKRQEIESAKFHRRAEKNRIKAIRQQMYGQKKAEAKREKYVASMTKKISKAVDKKTRGMEKAYRLSQEFHFHRLTPPKKRNWLSRLINRSRYEDGKYDELREDIEIGYITEDEVRNHEISKREWKKIQKYEDARSDIKAKKALKPFKVALVSLALITGILACKAAFNKLDQSMQEVHNALMEDAKKTTAEMEIRTIRARAMRFEDQQWFYEYTGGQPTMENWEKLPEEYKEYIRNPVKAAEAAFKHNNDQSYMYVMTGGDISSYTWENLPTEIKQYIRKPSITASEAQEKGWDQRYLYELSRGQITEAFWMTLPPEVQVHVRNPKRLAEKFAEEGDALGYLRTLSDIEDTRRLSTDVWHFLPKELKEIIPDPRNIIEVDGVQFEIQEDAGSTAISSEATTLEDSEDGIEEVTFDESNSKEYGREDER